MVAVVVVSVPSPPPPLVCDTGEASNGITLTIGVVVPTCTLEERTVWGAAETAAALDAGGVRPNHDAVDVPLRSEAVKNGTITRHSDNAATANFRRVVDDRWEGSKIEGVGGRSAIIESAARRDF
jgi:hypothetical protein